MVQIIKKTAFIMLVLLVLLMVSSYKCFAEDHFGVGLGLTTDNISISNSSFTVPVLHAYYEYQFDYLAFTASYYGLNLYFPVLAVDFGLVADIFKMSAGVFSDASFFGHTGIFVTGSIIFDNNIELKVFFVPANNFSQPKYSIKEGFINGSFVKNENGLFDIPKGYLGILMCMRF
ncbi:MAG: hypothetical protein A2231_05600 [Candidatus Firestonebacteria bacterium RIFOXYA2_FULL_40_8]|nr:MAG: hypothetical protein A2231_05600 [Candidatus Firestonebacteria bacterium RIFOXYA2_FULL_40_8]